MRSMSRRAPLTAHLQELRHTGAFAVIVGAAAAAVGLLCFGLGVSIVQVDVHASVAQAAVATFMPGFVAGWVSFLFRRRAWLSPRSAAMVGGGAATVGVVSHTAVLNSGFYDTLVPAWQLPMAWADGCVDGVQALCEGPLTSSIAHVGASVAVIVGAAVATALVQRWASGARQVQTAKRCLSFMKRAS